MQYVIIVGKWVSAGKKEKMQMIMKQKHKLYTGFMIASDMAIHVLNVGREKRGTLWNTGNQKKNEQYRIKFDNWVRVWHRIWCQTRAS